MNMCAYINGLLEGIGPPNWQPSTNLQAKLKVAKTQACSTTRDEKGALGSRTCLRGDLCASWTEPTANDFINKLHIANIVYKN